MTLVGALKNLSALSQKVKITYARTVKNFVFVYFSVGRQAHTGQLLRACFIFQVKVETRSRKLLQCEADSAVGTYVGVRSKRLTQLFRLSNMYQQCKQISSFKNLFISKVLDVLGLKDSTELKETMQYNTNLPIFEHFGC